tara:strand:- start:42 stop:575 length:534 start_codon:yes stop_codon:yes gene_type:complete
VKLSNLLNRLLFAIALALLNSCSSRVNNLNNDFFVTSKQEPSISGNGRNIAMIIDINGRKTVQLLRLNDKKKLSLRKLKRYQPHSSPSLSWNARYIAVLAQRGGKRIAIIEDRKKGSIHYFALPYQRVPSRLSLSPNGTQLALQVSDKGKWQIFTYDLSKIIEPDLFIGIDSKSGYR